MGGHDRRSRAVSVAVITGSFDMTMHTSPDAGWYADPNGGPGRRSGDGGSWPAATQQAPAGSGYPASDHPFQGYAPTGGTPGYPAAGSPYPAGVLPANRPPVNFFARNR